MNRIAGSPESRMTICYTSRHAPARPLGGFAHNLAATLVVGALTMTSALADPSQLRLRDDFEGEGFSPSGGLYYKDNAEQRAGKYRTQTDVVRSGSKGLSLSVVPQCRPDQSGCSERAEVWEKPEVLAAYDKTLWYALSIRLDDKPPSALHRYVVAQWKREIKAGADVDYSPFLAIRIIRGKLAVTIDSDAMPSRTRKADDQSLSCVAGAAPAMQRADAKQTRLLIAASVDAAAKDFGGYDTCASDLSITQRGGTLPSATSHWIDFVFMVKPGPRGSGEIELFADGSWIVSVKGRIGHEGPGLGINQYFKFGPYRDGGQKDTWQVFYDDFRRGPQCDDVAGPLVCNQLQAR
jgi:Polysaccharide lyase